MPEPSDWNADIIEEFRANVRRVQAEDQPLDPGDRARARDLTERSSHAVFEPRLLL
jgi:hypothetical protein